MYIPEARFSLWCDFVERDFLQTGFKELLANHVVNGATSNPAIFKNAFLNSPAYKEDIQSLRGKSPKEIYETLAIKDIQTSADLLKSLYDEGDDGFISFEVDPSLCNDAQATIAEGKRLFKSIGRPNVMIKVPATQAGFTAMEALIADGINVNATLIFSPAQAKGCLDAFNRGTDAFLAIDPETKAPQAVISVFVSRFDRKVDPICKAKGIQPSLLGIYNATKIYHMITKSDPLNIRTLFASTGVKGDGLVKEYYITNLLFENCINTAPLDTIDAFVKTGIKEVQTPKSEAEIDAFLAQMTQKGINLKDIYDALMSEGIEAFKIAFKDILEELEKG